MPDYTDPFDALVAPIAVTAATMRLPKDDPRRALAGWAMPPERAESVLALLRRDGYEPLADDYEPPAEAPRLDSSPYDKFVRARGTPIRPLRARRGNAIDG